MTHLILCTVGQCDASLIARDFALLANAYMLDLISSIQKIVYVVNATTKTLGREKNFSPNQLALGITLPITIKSDYKLKAPVTTHTTLGKLRQT
jgi:hypothetical protein